MFRYSNRIKNLHLDLFRSYATKGGAPPAGVKGSNEFIADDKSEQLRQFLYPSDVPQPNSNRTSPSLQHREDVEKSVNAVFPGQEVHDTITRAYLVLRRRQEDERKNDLKYREGRLIEALNELKSENETMWEDAVARPQKISSAKVGKKKAQTMRIPGLFPRDLKPPTETPRNVMWNVDWKPRQEE